MEDAEEALLADGEIGVGDDRTVTERGREGEATHVAAETAAAELEVVEVGSSGEVAGVASAGEAAPVAELACSE